MAHRTLNAERRTVNLEQTINDRPYTAALFFVCLAAVLFHPLFLGKFVLSGTDVLYTHYPNILYGYREFQEFGSFSLWNRYIFSGMDFTGSMHAHFLNPLYWPLLLFPEKYVFHALTAGFMAMNALIGWLWFLISARLGVRGSGAVLVGVVAQAGMFFWFAMTTVIAVPMYLFTSIAMYLILTRESRSALANYLGLSLAFGLLFVTPHPSYLLGFSLPLLVVFLIVCFPGWLRQPWRGFTPIFVAASITGVLLAAYRLLPVALTLMREGIVLGTAGTPGTWNYAYFGLTAFNPIALGIHLGDSIDIAHKLGFGSGRHTQAHNALYFGVAPLILIYIALRTRSNAVVVYLATTYLAFQLSYLYAFQPITDIVYLLLYPFGHEGLFRPATNFAFLFLLICGLRDFACRDPQRLQKIIREVVIIAGLVMLAALAMHARLLYKIPEVVDLVGSNAFLNRFRFVMLGLAVGVALLCRLPLKTLARVRTGMLGVLLGGSIFILATLAILRRLPEVERVMEAYSNSLAAISTCIAVVLLARATSGKLAGKVVLICFVATILLLLVPMPASTSGKASSSYLAAIAAWGAFVAMAGVTLHLLAKSGSGNMKPALLLQLLLVVTVVDLIGAYGSYSYVNVSESPFVRQAYSSRNLKALVDSYNVESAMPMSGNLLSNPEFRRVSNQIEGWALGGKDIALCKSSETMSPDKGAEVACVCYPKSDGGGNLYQDVVLREPSNVVAMGVWVRAEKGMDAAFFMNSESNNVGTGVGRIKGDGRWHWLENQLVADEKIKTIRPHINLAKAGCMEVYAPRLVHGIAVRPDRIPIGDEVVQPARPFPVQVDLNAYRVNHVDVINKLSSNDLMSNIAMVARTPTYAGVDSDLSRDYVSFLKVFSEESTDWYHRAGLLSSRKNNRLLDLLGVGYDVSDSGVTIVRPHAIPRIAAFRKFEVQMDRDQALDRLNDDTFDPTTTVLLDGEPALASQQAGKGDRVRPLAYGTPQADTITVKIVAEMPRVILLNDRFSANWIADWNGQALPILRANTIFMAVALPEGAGELTFKFRPKLFLQLSLISAAAVLLLLLGGGIVIARSLLKRHLLAGAGG